MEKVAVDLGDRTYDVAIGERVLFKEEERLRELVSKPSAIVADAKVWELHGGALPQCLKALPVIEVPQGEASKSWHELERVCEALLGHGVERGGSVVAFGGGVTGDLAGFCAAIVRRGCRLVQVPTTLLSQVDSSVGGKTAINTGFGKNLVGAFHQPAAVLIDPGFLSTLPDREVRAGFAEVIKAGLLGRKDVFAWLEEHAGDVLARDAAALTHAIAQSCRLKADVVARDEREAGERALLNLGHTFGHAVEAAGQYDGRVLHGEAVALGMAMAARFSVRHGMTDPLTAKRVEALLRRSGLPTRLADLKSVPVAPEELLAAMKQDKKVEAGALTLILLRGIGEAFVAKDQDQGRVLDFLQDEAQLPAL
jgi:3-dehydroquinate synthase